MITLCKWLYLTLNAVKLDAEPPLVNLNSLHTPGSKTLEVGNDNPLISKIKYTELLDMLRRFIIQVVKSCREFIHFFALVTDELTNICSRCYISR
jgi:hypothetical protein